MKPLAFALALAYPVLAHVAVARGDARLMAGSLVVLVLAMTLPGIARGRAPAFVGFVLGVALVYAAHRADSSALLLYLPPVALNVLIGWIFARTLGPGGMPLVERFSRALNEGHTFDPRIPAYARRVTIAWAVLLFSLALVDLVLALFAVPDGMLLRFGVEPPFTVPQAWWSAFANFLGWGFIALLFVGEWFYRKRHFPVQPYRNFAEFAQRFARIGPALWRTP